MKCPWLYKAQPQKCSAVQGLVVLSICELEKYCESGNYILCPVYKAQRFSGELLSVYQYREIYLNGYFTVNKSTLARCG